MTPRPRPDPVDDDLLGAWCETHLHSSLTGRLFETGHLSAVVGVELEDGRAVVIKVRDDWDRIRACVEVQRVVFEAGFPCPEPLAGPAPLGRRVATAERFVPPGDPPPAPPPASSCASLLARLLAVTPPAARYPALWAPPPWVGWDHDGPGLWPPPDDLDADLDDHPGPAFLDRAAAAIRRRLARHVDAPTIGHVDWEAHNLDWRGGEPVVVHDWDSLAVRPEATIVGAAASVHASFGATVVSGVEATATFIDAYGRARAIPLTADEREAAWAAGLWVLVFNAKKETVGGGTGYLAALEEQLARRASHAGIDLDP